MVAPHTVRSGRAGGPHMNRRRLSGNADKPAARSPTNDASPCKGRLSDDDATSRQITAPQRSRSIVAGVLQDCCAAPGTGGNARARVQRTVECDAVAVRTQPTVQQGHPRRQPPPLAQLQRQPLRMRHAAPSPLSSWSATHAASTTAGPALATATAPAAPIRPLRGQQRPAGISPRLVQGHQPDFRAFAPMLTLPRPATHSAASPRPSGSRSC